MLLGCIADDLTGATDLAIMLTRGGMRTLQLMSVPESNVGLDGYDAIVIALKTRTCPVEEAVSLSLKSADALLKLGARQIYFKYCSTFDSTETGNIGPVAEALLVHLGGDIAIACPAFPTNKRTVYMGNLFVGDVPLAESPMKDHPLTPMRDSNLVRVLQRQTRAKVGLVPFAAVEQGAGAIGKALGDAKAAGQKFVIVDAVTDAHLMAMGEAVATAKLVTGGSGAALGLPANFRRQGLLKSVSSPASMHAPTGRQLIIAGSCSEATRGQVSAAKAAGLPSFEVDPLAIKNGSLTAGSVTEWATQQPAGQPVLIFSSADPAKVGSVQKALGREAAGSLVETLLAETAKQLAAAGFSRVIVAGGETSGAVVNGLGVGALEIGPEIDPGVPWTRAVGRDLVLALKSGNFGAPDFFLKAWKLLS